ncbi:MAG: hypothetical protein JSR26_01165 [Proteobacteria bacterium]|nr:hypothetical protein [Pseudomonadota bacterium]
MIAATQSRAFLLSLTGHGLLLFALFHSWVREVADKANTEKAPVGLIEVTLAGSSVAPSHIVRLDIPAAVLARPMAKAVVWAPGSILDRPNFQKWVNFQPAATVQHPPVELSHLQSKLEVVTTSAASEPLVAESPPIDVHPSTDATSGADDPYAVMRRLRAEAERQYQTQQQAVQTQQASNDSPSSDAVVNPDPTLGAAQVMAAVQPFSPFAPPSGHFPFRLDSSGFPQAFGVQTWACWIHLPDSAFKGRYVFYATACDPIQPGG